MVEQQYEATTCPWLKNFTFEMKQNSSKLGGSILMGPVDDITCYRLDIVSGLELVGERKAHLDGLLPDMRKSWDDEGNESRSRTDLGTLFCGA